MEQSETGNYLDMRLSVLSHGLVHPPTIRLPKELRKVPSISTTKPLFWQRQPVTILLFM